MEFVIDRSKWRCGGGDSTAKRGEGCVELLNNLGFMCCLGQISRQLGVDDGRLIGAAYPSSTGMLIGDLTEQCGSGVFDGITVDTDLSILASEANDSENLSDSEREERLRELFGEHGHILTFINDYVKP